MLLNKLHPRLQDHVKDKNWPDLTPIQKEAFQPIFDGISCIVEAPTSGGKTEAVLFPLLTRIANKKSTGFKVLYIAPLKALLNDLELRVVPYAKKCYMEAFKWHGDVSQTEKVEQMLFPSDILLTTPESIEAILLRKANWQEIFINLETIVIDEAHYFALTERGSHLVALLERITDGIKKQPQRIAVTATIGNPNDLLNWLTGNRPGGISIRVKSTVQKERDFKINFIDEENDNLYQSLYNLLVQRKSIVFEQSRTKTEETAAQINEINLRNQARIPVKVKTHHSSVSKGLREEAEGSIKQATESSLNAIISTSTLELGIDIGDLDQVIQIGALNSSGSFLQRVGRTGRREGKPQFFRGICFESDQLALLTGCVSLGLNNLSERILFPKRAFHILAHQAICICLQKRGTTADSIWNTLSKAACFSQITRSEFDSLLHYMITEEFLRPIDGNVLLTSNKTEKEFLRANWKRLFAIFDTGIMYNVVDGKKVIGTLDSDFMKFQELPFIFVLGGMEWFTKEIDHEAQQVKVCKNETGIAPKWSNMRSFEIPFELAQEVGRLLMNEESLPFLDTKASIIFERERSEFNQLQWNDKEWPLDGSIETNILYLWTFCGDKINRAIAVLIETELSVKATPSYKNVTIKIGKEDPITSDSIINLLTSIREVEEKELEKKILSNIKANWFSKFSVCLPDHLSKVTIREKGIDLSGLLRELHKVTIRHLN